MTVNNESALKKTIRNLRILIGGLFICIIINTISFYKISKTRLTLLDCDNKCDKKIQDLMFELRFEKAKKLVAVALEEALENYLGKSEAVKLKLDPDISFLIVQENDYYNIGTVLNMYQVYAIVDIQYKEVKGRLQDKKLGVVLEEMDFYEQNFLK